MYAQKVLNKFITSTPERKRHCLDEISVHSQNKNENNDLSLPHDLVDECTLDAQIAKSLRENVSQDDCSAQQFLEDTMIIPNAQVENIQDGSYQIKRNNSLSAFLNSVHVNQFDTFFSPDCKTEKEALNSSASQNNKILEKSIDQQSKDINNVVNELYKSLHSYNMDEIELFDELDQDMLAHFDDSELFFGLPAKAKQLFKFYKNVDNLYAWQIECLNLEALKQRKNLIYALPTSGGKTLVAEILMLKEVLCRQKNVLFILPFVAIVQEKVWGLSSFAVQLEFLVEEYAAGKGTIPPRKRRNKNSIYIATIEKALGLVRSLVELNRLDELGLVVVDELHLIGDGSRGSTLEILLSTLLFFKNNLQVIGMSATIGNIDELAQFMRAEVYCNDFRPVKLKEFIKIGELIYSLSWDVIEGLTVNPERNVNYAYSPQVAKLDPDHIGGLVMDVIPKGSCLIFCPTKKNCENVAVLLCKVIFKELLEYKSEEKKELLRALKGELASDVCSILTNTIPYGVAYHHSGLTSEERKLLEDGFRAGVISVLCCTSTLAAGVNLPAQRVILRSPFVGKDFITLSTYKQMVGRAGRAGLGDYGESVLICPQEKFSQVCELLKQPMDKATSSLHLNSALPLRGYILSAVCLKMATSLPHLKELLMGTLLGVQAERLELSVKALVKENVKELIKIGAIETVETENSANINDSNDIFNESNKIFVNTKTEFKVSTMGNAAIKGCMDLRIAKLLYSDMKTAQMSLVLLNILHLLYLVTPYEYMDIRPNYATYYQVYSSLDSEGKQTAKVLGISESNAIKMMTGKAVTNVPERVLIRFYVTLILYDLWNQAPISEVAEKYHVTRGTVQGMMVSTATFSCNVLRFCEQIDELWAFKDLLTTFAGRIAHCCSSELVPLMELPNVKKVRAMQLYKAGYKKIEDIAKANPFNLVDNIENLPLKVAKQLISSAKMLLIEKVENLREEAEDVLDELR